jgi:hypothetical protein
MPLHLAGAAPTPQSDFNVVVQITSPQPGERVRGRVQIEGYATDRRSRSGSGVDEASIELHLNDMDSPSERSLLALVPYTALDSPDAAARLGPRFDQVGFLQYWETCAFPPGTYTLTVYVFSRVVPGARNSHRVEVEVEPCAPSTPITQDDLYTRAPLGADVIRLAGPETGARSLFGVFADFAAGVDARCPRADVDCYYGLDFRRVQVPGRGRAARYAFWVHPTTETFELVYSPPADEPDRLMNIVPPTSSRAVRGGTAQNRLGVIVEDTRIRLFVNGIQVADVQDDHGSWGAVGYIAGQEGEGPLEVEFDRLLVSTPGPIPALARVLAGEPGSVLLLDDFSDPTSGWVTESSDPSTHLVGYEDGTYVLNKIATRSGGPSVVYPAEFSDFQAEVDAGLVDGGPDTLIRLDFRRQANDHRYSLVVDPYRPSLGLERVLEGGADWLLVRNPAPVLNPGTAWNRLGVRAYGPVLVLLVNGQELGRVYDDTIDQGHLAFYVGTDGPEPATARFDNLLVTGVAGPDPAPLAIPGRVLLRDAFTDPSSGWEAACDPPSLWEGDYAGGEYRVVKPAGVTQVPGPCHSARFGDFLVEIDARLEPPTEDAFVGFEFRLQSHYHGNYAEELSYVLTVTPDSRRFVLTRVDGGRTAGLFERTDVAAINPGAEWNRLGVRARGEDIVILVNGQEVGRVHDDTYGAGTFAFGVGHAGGEPAEARFRDFVVTSLD